MQRFTAVHAGFTGIGPEETKPASAAECDRKAEGRKHARWGVALLLAFASVALAMPAEANIIYDSQLYISAQGFGAAPRLLTLQTTGTESGCASFSGGSLSTGSGACIPDAQVTQGNSFTNAGGNEELGANKTNYASLGASSISDASQLVIIYNSSQTGANPGTTIEDLTLKFYDSAGNLKIAVDNSSPLVFAGEHPGNGGAGFALVLDSTEAGLVNNAFGGNIANAVITAESTITGSNDGPDTFALVSRANASVPEPSSLALLGIALAGLGLFGRRRRDV